ncbi:MAG: hypothetical protein NZ518_12200 [Dehalococcoidia bacterium]|nr:hypothetical protein [Dehalococcoidia bacterium]
MRRFWIGVGGMLGLFFAVAVWSGGAQELPVWVRTEVVRGEEGCTWAIAHWSDGSVTRAPFLCPVAYDDVVGVATRGVRADGCEWLERDTADGAHYGVPLRCPEGVVVVKPEYPSFPELEPVAVTPTPFIVRPTATPIARGFGFGSRPLTPEELRERGWTPTPSPRLTHQGEGGCLVGCHD